jgi:antagonist of KipI
MIRILKAGILDTLQDKGRFGFAKWGINTNGAMDQFGMAVSNALVGNTLDTTVVEMHFPAPQILFLSDALVSVTGGDFTPTVNERTIGNWKSIHVPAGSVLSFRKRVKGKRCYLSVHGGFHIPLWLGSSSTNLKSKTGGFHGRALKAGDEIGFGESKLKNHETDLKVFPWTVNPNLVYDNQPVAISAGNEWSWIDPSAIELIKTGTFSLEPSSDRMASFLRHDPITFIKRDQLLSSAVTFGTIQALPSGKLCVLMADHQTTGGYPRVAHVISAHLPKFSQLSPGAAFTFSVTTIEEAEKMLLSLQDFILALEQTLQKKLTDHYGIN